jgi:hypothetical protein
LVPIPEVGEVGLVPDIDDQAIGHAVGLDVAEEMGQVVVPAGPVAVVTRVGCRGILRSVGAPEIVDQEDEFRAVLAGGFVVGERGRKAGLSLSGRVPFSGKGVRQCSTLYSFSPQIQPRPGDGTWAPPARL